MINQNLKILHTASFFLAELTVSTLLIILQSLLATFFLILLWLASHLLIEQIRTHIPYFYLPFCFMVQSSRAIDQK